MIAMRDIRAFAKRIATEFKPKRIILFGSYAYGKPTRDSDVDLMVVFPGKLSAFDRALDIRMKLHPGFPIDVLTRTETEIRHRIAIEDWFIMDIMEKGKVLYEAHRDGMGGKSGRGLRSGKARVARP